MTKPEQAQQFKELIRKALKDLYWIRPLNSEEAVELLLGTAIQESQLKYRRQIGGGPALGLYQMEPATHNDLWVNYLRYRPKLAHNVLQIINQNQDQTNYAIPNVSTLVDNDVYSTLMARICYLRAPDPLPEVGDIEAAARYWKRWWNSEEGKGTIEQYIKNWRLFHE